MVSFQFSKQIEKVVFRLVTSAKCMCLLSSFNGSLLGMDLTNKNGTSYSEKKVMTSNP